MLKKCLVDDRTAAGLTPVELHLDPAAAAIIDGVPAGPPTLTPNIWIINSAWLWWILWKMPLPILPNIRPITARPLSPTTKLLPSALPPVWTVPPFTSTPAHASPMAANLALGCEMGISTQKLHARGPHGSGRTVHLQIHRAWQRTDPRRRRFSVADALPLEK